MTEKIFNPVLFKFSLIFGILSLGVVTCFGATYTYIGATNGSWNTTTNWSGGTNYPGFASGDIAIINSNVNINLNSTLPNAVSSITLNTGFTATITISATRTLAVTGTITIGSASASNLTITGAGSSTVSGITLGYQSTFTIGSSGVTTTNVTLNSGTTLAMNQNNNAFTNYGTFTATASTLTLSGGPANFTNYGTVNLNAATTMQVTNNTSNITNSGTLNINASTITLAGGPNPFNSSGTVNLNSGSTFTVTNNNTFFTNTGTFNATSATISFSGSAGNGGINNTSPGVFTATSTTLSLVAGSGNVINNTGTFTATLCPITLGGGPSFIYNTAGTFAAYGCTIALAQSSTLTNTGTFTLAASGATPTTVNFGYAAFISNTGTFYAGTSNSQCILNVNSQNSYINSSASGGTFYLGSTSIIYLTGYAANVTNTSPATFILQSDNFGSAAIGSISSTSTGFVGTFNVQRYFQGSSTYDAIKKRWLARNYRIISSPVNTGTLVNSNYIYDLNYIVGPTVGLTTTAVSTTNAFVTGATGGNTSAGNSSLYLYRENIIPSGYTFTSGNFIGITNIVSASALYTSDGATTNNIPIGNGVFFFFRGAANNWTTRTKSPFIAPENVILTSKGNINQQAVTVKDWYNTGSSTLGYTVTGVGAGIHTNTAVRGFNMVGNPYACSIDWNTAFAATGITLTNVNPTIWVFNPVTNQYDTYITNSSSTGTSNGGGTDGLGNATNIIASGQGFFVQANGVGAATMVFNESAKSAASQPTGINLLMGTPAGRNAVQQLLRLKLSIDSLNYDNIAIGFNSTASANYNGTEDAVYLPGANAPEGLSSFSGDNIKLAINYLPLPKQTQQVIKLNVDAALTGLYTLQRTTLNALPPIYEIWLMDKYKKDSLDIRKYPNYAFDVNLTDTSTFGSNRFEIVIRQNAALGVHLLDFTAKKAVAGIQITWTTENEQNYTNFTVQRSTDNGVTFNVLGGFVSSAMGTYSFQDKNPPDSGIQYRLQLADLNGTISYSKVVTLLYSNSSGNIAANNISVYPNPAGNIINLAIKQGSTTYPVQTNSQSSNLSALQTLNLSPSLAAIAVEDKGTQSFGIKIISVTGSVIKTATSQGLNWQDNISRLTPGTYIIQVINNSNNSVIGKSTFIKL